ADLVVLAGSLYPIPSRTRPLNSPAPMVLSLKAWKSRSLPGLPRTDISSRLGFSKAAAASPRRLFLRSGQTAQRTPPVGTAAPSCASGNKLCGVIGPILGVVL